MSRLTRRTFVTILSAAAVAAATLPHLRGSSDDPDDRPRSPWAGTTRWIGHC